MSFLPPPARRGGRRGTRAASNEPTATPVAGARTVRDDASVASTARRSNRIRNQLTASGASSYGNQAVDTVVNQQTFQATQTQAVAGLQNTLAQAQTRAPQTEAIEEIPASPKTRRLPQVNLTRVNIAPPEVDERIPEEVRADMVGSYDAQGTFYPNSVIRQLLPTEEPLDDESGTPPPPPRVGTRVLAFLNKVGPGLSGFLRRSNDATPDTGNALPNDESREWDEDRDLYSAGPSRRPSQPRAHAPDDERPSDVREAAATQPASWAFSLPKFIRSPLGFLVKHPLIVLLLIAVLMNTIGLLDVYRGPLLGAKHDILPLRFRHLRSGDGQTPCPGGDPEEIRKLQDDMSKLHGLYKDLDTLVNDRPVPGIDYISPQNNAEVWQKMTSPEKKRPVTGWTSFLWKEKEFTAYQHIVAPFKDRKKMWCAPSNHGKAQVTVMMAAQMAPTELVIRQNLAMSEALDADTYPKEIELWVDIEDDKAREAILADVLKRFPDIMTKTEAQRGRQLAEAQALPSTFIPVGRYLYDVNANQAVQGWPIRTNIGHYNASTMRAAIRISSNWGNIESTCLHEVSLYGDHKDERKVYTNPTKGEYVETVKVNPLDSMDCNYEEVDAYNGRGGREHMTVCSTRDSRTATIRTMHPWGTITA